MSVVKKVVLAIIWILVVVGCVWVLNNAKNAKKIQKNSKEVNGTITEILSARTKVEEKEKEEGNRTIVTYTCTLCQKIRVSYVVDGKEYFYDSSELESYSKNSELPFNSGEESEIRNTKGYKVGESIALYVDEKDPANAHLKTSVDHSASGTKTKVLLAIVVFMGFVLSSCVLAGGSRKRY